MASSVERVQAAAEAAGERLTIKRMDASTRTAEEAAEACGCAVRHIVKSLIFQSEADGALILLLVAGDARVDLGLAERAVGSALRRADPRLVREVTGFAIGGVSPIGHLKPVRTILDERLDENATLYAAAGAPDAVFATVRATLMKLTGAHVGRLR